ncbi:hypothetical protein ABI59_18335 [Acidobacteria bacterium Mor1]|nr:hypothetical protein ABI59_18335 [Acidobacteria bacterium Mor1]
MTRLMQDLALKAIWAPLLVFSVHMVLWQGTDLYDRIPHVDIPLHLFGGLAIAYFFAGCLNLGAERGWVDQAAGMVRGLLLVGLSCVAGVLWEYGEMTVFKAIGADLQVSIADTLVDILVGTAGGALFALAEWIWRQAFAAGR